MKHRVENFLRDLRYAFRSLGKDRRLALLAIFALALGIGATTVVFSVIYNGLLHPFPYKDSDRLVNFMIHDVKEPGRGGRSGYSMTEMLDYREQNHVLEDLIGCDHVDALYNTGEGVEHFDGVNLTANAFSFLDVQPLLGRMITPEDANPGAPPVFAMNYRVWNTRFNADPKIVGTTMTLNGVPKTLVAIMPRRFGLCAGEVWMPTSWKRSAAPTSEPFGEQYFWTIARLKSGVSEQAAAADLDVVAERLAKVYPKNYPPKFTVQVNTLASNVVGDFKGMLYALIGAVAMLLLIACSNVANLLLSRATSREKEIAVRASIGASRGQLIRQLVVESFVLAIAGGMAGCGLAYGGLKWIVATIPLHQWIPDEAAIGLNLSALAFTLGVAMLTTILCGLAPAFHAVRGDLYARLKDTGHGVQGGFRYGKFRAGLVIIEVGLSIVLLAGAGLMMRSVFALTHVDLGFNPKNILTARIPLPKGRYDTATQKKLFFQEVLRRVKVIPGVVTATETISLPPYGGPRSEVIVPGKTHSEAWNAMFDACSETYFQTIDRHLLRGTLLSESDIESARLVAVVNQTLARNFFGNENPIGQKIHFKILDEIPETPHGAYFEIVGIVSDAKNQGLRDPPMPEAFLPYTISGFGDRGILVRTSVDPDSILNSLRKEIWAVDRNVALADTGSLVSYLERFSYAQPKFGVASLGVFAGIGLMLVVIGVFSVMAYTVSLQTHEIGIRMALGAQQNNVLGMMLRKGMRLIAAGILIGLLASFGLTRLVASQIWGVSATDPLTFSAVVVIVVAVGLIACLLPARRATRVDPLVALRYE